MLAIELSRLCVSYTIKGLPGVGRYKLGLDLVTVTVTVRSMLIDAQEMLSLRGHADAVRVICERLRVKEMGPADHIRTKHEVRDFVKVGALEAVQTIIANAQQRRDTWRRVGGE